MILLSLALACSTPEPAPPASPPAAPAAPAPASAVDESRPHHHEAAHGGVVQVVGDVHVEALFMADGVMFWLEDAAQSPLSPDGWTGSAVVKGPAGVTTVDLMSMGDHLHAPATLAPGQPASAVLTLTHAGKADSASFSTESVGMEAHAHTSLHGGEVFMQGNYHVEYAPTHDEYRLWLTDEHRNPITDGVSATLVDGDQRLPMTLDPGSRMLSAKAEGAGERPVRVELVVGADKLGMDLPAAGAHHP